MKFLHTSDWHVGRTIRGRSRDVEHEAALQQLLTYTREHAVDAVLIAGDVFDTSTPPPEAERLVYQFLRELHGLGVPAVMIAGNHDHPRRFEAIAPLLQTIGVHSFGDPRGADEGGVVTLQSRDGRETANVAALPWVTERRAVEFTQLQQGIESALVGYADQVSKAMEELSTGFRPDTVNVLMAHALVNDATVGVGGGERVLHMAMGIYGIQRQRLPIGAQYVAFGHVHKAQELVKSPAAWYSGSLMQLDFGETRQDKSVNLVELHPRQPAKVTLLPIDQGVRRLVDLGSPLHGVTLSELTALRDEVGDAWLRVFIDLDLPMANLPALVRDTLPNAIHVERVRPVASESEDGEPALGPSAPEDMFATFYRGNMGRGVEAGEATMAMFRRLLVEATDAAPEA
ncbi:MAG TPA: exonuclease SbcCD subunit D [Dehalococcoidia bacterium]|nr:exonuclease SbcCD subunit D [Dehalococcoidia bacterium]